MESQVMKVGQLAAALAKAQGEMTGAKKDTNNTFFRSKYADLASVWDAIRAPFSKNGLAVTQTPSTEYLGNPEFYEVTTKGGEKRTLVRCVTKVSVETKLSHSSGESESGTLSCMLPNGDPQAVGSAISYLRRYGLQAMAGVAPEDDDGNEASGHYRHEEPAPAKPAISESRVADFLSAIQTAADMDALQKVFTDAWVASGEGTEARAAFMAAKEKRKSELMANKEVARG